jgi:hypothetical protein
MPDGRMRAMTTSEVVKGDHTTAQATANHMTRSRTDARMRRGAAPWVGVSGFIIVIV